jgi:hypothetical protein
MKVCPNCGTMAQTAYAAFCTQCGTKIGPLQFPMSINPDWHELCVAWHMGQTSAMYSASSMGTIHNKDILLGLCLEVFNIMNDKDYTSMVEPDDRTKIDAFYNWLDHLVHSEE